MAKENACCTIPLPEQPMDCDCCPVAPLVGCGLVTGDVFVHRYGMGDEEGGSGSDGEGEGGGGGGSGQGGAAAQRAQRGAGPSGAPPPALSAREALRRRGKGGASCRAVRFAADGAGLVCGYESGSLQLLDLETGKLSARLPRAHGGLKIWDLRAPSTSGAAFSYDKHGDFISGLTERIGGGAGGTGGGGGGGGGGNALVAVSGDGTLSVHDLRKLQPVARSESDADDEMLSAVVLKHGRKVVAGCQSGVLSIFSWGYWNDCSDRFPGHPESVDALVAFDEDTVLSGSSDGALRVLGVQPNKLLGVVGEYAAGTPVERLALGWDHRVAASTSHEAAVRLWDLSCLHDDSGGEEEEGEEGEEAVGAAGGGAREAQPAGRGGGGGGESGSGSGSGSDSGSGSGSDSDSDGGARKRKRRGERTRMTKANNKPKTGGNFFADLL